jgi:hypothetical protein
MGREGGGSAVMLLNSTGGGGMGPETIDFSMKETPRRRITDTSSLIKISTDQLGNRSGDGGFWADI